MIEGELILTIAYLNEMFHQGTTRRPDLFDEIVKLLFEKAPSQVFSAFSSHHTEHRAINILRTTFLL